MVDPGDILALRAAFQANPRDLGVGLYNTATGEIRVGSFDKVTGQGGHQGLADALGITDNSDWRGFMVSSSGQFAPMSHYNLADGSVTMLPALAQVVEHALRQCGLVK